MFLLKPKIHINKNLYERLSKMAEHAGYASTEEFITHVLEREVSNLEQASSDKEVEKRLRGLGYIE